VTTLAKSFALAIASIAGAHALAFHIIAFLPDPSVIILGFFGGNTAALEALRSDLALPAYSQVLANVFSGDLGQTLDRTDVGTELWQASLQSMPRVLAVLALTAFFASLAAFRSNAVVADRRRGGQLAELLVFLPVFIFPLALLVLLQSLAYANLLQGSVLLATIGCIASTAIGPAALAFLQARKIMIQQMASQHVRRLRSIGARPAQVRAALWRNFAAEFLPTFEKLVVSTLGFLIFSEYVFDLPGLGKLTVESITRSDPLLTMGIVLVFALATNIARLLAVVIGARIENA
jgi:peptide/nickel transport system permease protein